VEANSTGGQGSRRAVAPSDDDETTGRERGRRTFAIRCCECNKCTAENLVQQLATCT
jgi:hypothetical protein